MFGFGMGWPWSPGPPRSGRTPPSIARRSSPPPRSRHGDTVPTVRIHAEERSPPVEETSPETSPMSPRASGQSLLPMSVTPARREELELEEPPTPPALSGSQEALLEPPPLPPMMEPPRAGNGPSSIQEFLQDLTTRLAADVLPSPPLGDNGAESENRELAVAQSTPLSRFFEGPPREESPEEPRRRQVTTMLLMNSAGGGPSVAVILDGRPNGMRGDFMGSQSRVTDDVLRQILSMVMPRSSHKHLAADAIEATFPVQPCTAELCDVCTVCMCDVEVEDPCRVLDCRHVFHADCINEWLTGESSGNVCDTDLCPNCRAPVAVKGTGDSAAEEEEEEMGMMLAEEVEDAEYDSDDMMLPELEDVDSDDMMLEDIEEVDDEDDDDWLIRDEPPVARRAWELPEPAAVAADNGEESNARGEQQSGSPSHVTDMASWLT